MISVADSAKSPSIAPPALPAPRKAARPKLLLVEDEIIVALEMAHEFRASGWDVIGPASSLAEGFALLSLGHCPDAAVLDVNVDRELVFPLAEELRRRGIPLVFCTGCDMPPGSVEFQGAPVVRKPTTTMAILDQLKRVQPGVAAARHAPM